MGTAAKFAVSAINPPPENFFGSLSGFASRARFLAWYGKRSNPVSSHQSRTRSVTSTWQLECWTPLCSDNAHAHRCGPPPPGSENPLHSLKIECYVDHVLHARSEFLPVGYLPSRQSFRERGRTHASRLWPSRLKRSSRRSPLKAQ